jgi:hypothetical protein
VCRGGGALEKALFGFLVGHHLSSVQPALDLRKEPCPPAWEGLLARFGEVKRNLLAVPPAAECVNEVRLWPPSPFLKEEPWAA